MEQILMDVLSGLKYFLIYMFSIAGVLFLVNKIFPLPKELFRKLFHFVAFSSVVVMIYAANEWIAAAIVPIGVIIVNYPGLAICSKNKKFTKMFSERRPGEMKSSLFQLFGTMALIISISWGLLGHKELAVASILMWGFGDAAAALIGKKYGKHKVLRFKHVDHKKSWEGTAAMSVVAFVFGLASLMVVGNVPLVNCLPAIVIAAPLAAITELITKGGYDTVTVPLVSAFAIYCSYVFMGIA
jgi:dolichol kinase